MEANSPVIPTWAKSGLVEHMSDYLDMQKGGRKEVDTYEGYGQYRTRVLLTDVPTGLVPPPISEADGAKVAGDGNVQAALLHEHDKSCFLCDDKGEPLLVDVPIE